MGVRGNCCSPEQQFWGAADLRPAPGAGVRAHQAVSHAMEKGDGDVNGALCTRTESQAAAAGAWPVQAKDGKGPNQL